MGVSGFIQNRYSYVQFSFQGKRTFDDIPERVENETKAVVSGNRFTFRHKVEWFGIFCF